MYRYKKYVGILLFIINNSFHLGFKELKNIHFNFNYDM